MTQKDIEKARLYHEFYSVAENKALLDSIDFEDRIEYFRRFRIFYESRIYGTNIEKDSCIFSNV